ncbi:hypothetical protein [Sphingomonas morindae]|uniref:Uncharacterized protein n=1 Tax=Sphingomonas morindae TaxID=1541170 RepID=A0ABY4X6S5_9SPHN|nr:hypothetical protein [Sphingomonas morindae]USI72622.1 hypothetical protein LHA26_15265 [Sphingomonas morindae]
MFTKPLEQWTAEELEMALDQALREEAHDLIWAIVDELERRDGEMRV